MSSRDRHDLSFKGNDPGAVKFGNFINYYQFHPPEKRMELFAINTWKHTLPSKIVALDIGCNTGDLTQHLFDTFSTITPNVQFLGIDLDQTLIERSIEKNEAKNITFKYLDFMDQTQRIYLHEYLRLLGEEKFSIAFCFSVTMWIHLNHGDEGLKTFLQEICKLANIVVVEPQPWKCYKTAVRRMKRSSCEFEGFKSLKIRENVEQEIENIIKTNCEFIKIHESLHTDWGRKILVYKRK